uniref:Uncharacterized protein n=1 Tax=Clastoptera arizonana TaxID=38151 RepID=A0A1B6CC92_9HEMI
MLSSHFLTIIDVGNLIWFIHPTMFPRSSIDDLKLAIESDMLDKRLCLNSEKQYAWADLLLQIFGYPKSWNRGTLSTLGDLLLVFPDEILIEVNELLWIDAADTLQTKYYDTVEWIEPTPFVNVCINALEPEDKEAYYIAVKNLVKWKLVAVEKQLRTVSVASKNDLNLSNNLLSSETFDDSIHTDVSYGSDDILTTEETLYDDSEYEDDVTTYINELKTTLIEGDTTSIDYIKSSKSEDSLIKTELNYTKTTLGNQGTESTNKEHFTKHKNNKNIKKNKNISTTGYTPLYTSTRYAESSNFNTKIPFEQKKTTEIKEIININESIIPTTESNKWNNEATKLVNLLLTTNKINFPTPNFISQTTYEGLNIANATNQTDFIKHNGFSKFDETIHENAPAYENRTIVKSLTVSEPGKLNISYPVLSPSKVKSYTLESIRTSTESMATTDDYKSNEEKDDMLKKIDEYNLSAIDISPRRRRSTMTTLPDLSISCDALRVLGEVVSLFLSSVEIENIMSHSELNNCRDLLGKLDLPYESLKNIWGRLDEKSPTHLMGNLVKAAEVTDINIKNKEPWGLEDLYVYSQHITNSYLVGDLIEKLQLEDDLVNLNIETLAALNSLICNFDADIENIPNIRAGFHDIIAIIGALPKCPTKCLPALAKIAVSSDGFGNINRWDVEDVETLGWIVAGLNDDQWNELIQSPKHLLTGVTPNTIRCLSSTKLKEIPYTVIYKLPPLTLEAITDNQLVELTNELRLKVQDLKNLRIETNIMPKARNKISSDSSCNTCKESSIILIFILLLICQLIINF